MGRAVFTFLGLPCSGKSTLSARVAELTGFPVIHLGSTIRELAACDPEILDLVHKGKTMTAENAFNILESTLSSAILDSTDSILLDGFPRDLEGKAILDAWLDNRCIQLVGVKLNCSISAARKRWQLRPRVENRAALSRRVAHFMAHEIKIIHSLRADGCLVEVPNIDEDLESVVTRMSAFTNH